jgi:hypothetical protein
VTRDLLLAGGDIKPRERIVVFNTRAAQKYPDAVPDRLEPDIGNCAFSAVELRCR